MDFLTRACASLVVGALAGVVLGFMFMPETMGATHRKMYDSYITGWNRQ
jgi:hypothetical protein